jgi:hypothetical protein
MAATASGSMREVWRNAISGSSPLSDQGGMPC